MGLNAEGGDLESLAVLLPADHVAQMEEGVERAEHLDVAVEIDAAIVVEGVEAYEVGGKGIALGAEGLVDPERLSLGESLAVPEHELIVGQVLLPRVDATLDVFWERVAAEPAVVDDFWYHAI